MADYIGINQIITDQEYEDITIDEALATLAKDIEAQGQIQPIVINSQNEIVDGRRRLKAIKEILNRGKILYTVKDVTGDHKTLASLSANIYAHRYNEHQLANQIRKMTHLYKKLYPQLFDTGPKDNDIMSPDQKRPVEIASDLTGKSIRVYERQVAMLDRIIDGLREDLLDLQTNWKDIDIISRWDKEHQEEVLKQLQDDQSKFEMVKAIKQGATEVWQTAYPPKRIEPSKPAFQAPVFEAEWVEPEERPIVQSDMGYLGRKLRTMTRLALEGMTWDSIGIGHHPKNGIIMVKWLPDRDWFHTHQDEHWAQVEDLLMAIPKFKGLHIVQFENNNPHGRMLWNGKPVPKNMEEALFLGTSKELKEGFRRKD